jgi:hypothetical protein
MRQSSSESLVEAAFEAQRLPEVVTSASALVVSFLTVAKLSRQKTALSEEVLGVTRITLPPSEVGRAR